MHVTAFSPAQTQQKDRCSPLQLYMHLVSGHLIQQTLHSIQRSRKRANHSPLHQPCCPQSVGKTVEFQEAKTPSPHATTHQLHLPCIPTVQQQLGSNKHRKQHSIQTHKESVRPLTAASALLSSIYSMPRLGSKLHNKNTRAYGNPTKCTTTHRCIRLAVLYLLKDARTRQWKTETSI
jgi:hypothetical protein